MGLESTRIEVVDAEVEIDAVGVVEGRRKEGCP